MCSARMSYLTILRDDSGTIGVNPRIDCECACTIRAESSHLVKSCAKAVLDLRPPTERSQTTALWWAVSSGSTVRRAGCMSPWKPLAACSWRVEGTVARRFFRLRNPEHKVQHQANEQEHTGVTRLIEDDGPKRAYAAGSQLEICMWSLRLSG